MGQHKYKEKQSQVFSLKQFFVPLTTTKAICIITLVGLIVFFNSLFNNFVWDDLVFIVNNPEVHKLNLLELLQKNMFNDGPFYRPIPAFYFASLYTLFGPHAFFYHLLQLALHIVCTCLLFIFFARFFKAGVALFLALTFLVHPINVESVVFIGSTTSELFFLFGMSAFLLAIEKNVTPKRLLIIGILLLLSVLTKETGALFLLLLLTYRYLFKLDKLLLFAKLGLGIGATYVLLRVLVGEVTYQSISFVEVATLSFWERIIHIPTIIVYYLKTFVFPLQLGIWQSWVIKTVTIENFIIPLLVCLLFFVGLLVGAFYLSRADQRHEKDEVKHLPQYLFFLFWFLLGMSLLLQLVPLDMTVADRWFYFPIVGLLGLIGIGVQTLLKSYLSHKEIYLYTAVILLVLLSFRTVIRTFDWKDNITLYAHDLREQSDNYMLLGVYAREMYAAGNIDDAILYGKKSVSIYPVRGNLNELGTYYQAKKQYKEAIAAYTKAINTSQRNKNIVPYANVASALLLDQRPSEARDFIKTRALNDFPNASILYVFLAFAESECGNHQGALEATSRAQRLSPGDRMIAKLYYKLKNNVPIRWNP